PRLPDSEQPDHSGSYLSEHVRCPPAVSNRRKLRRSRENGGNADAEPFVCRVQRHGSLVCSGNRAFARSAACLAIRPREGPEGARSLRGGYHLEGWKTHGSECAVF